MIAIQLYRYRLKILTEIKLKKNVFLNMDTNLLYLNLTFFNTTVELNPLLPMHIVPLHQYTRKKRLSAPPHND